RKVKSGGAPRVVRSGAVALELAAEQAAGERAPYHQPKLLRVHHRQDFAFEIPGSNGVERLNRLEPRPVVFGRETERLFDLPRREIGAADVANQTAFHEIV